ncbi:MAG: 50S ribosomal protein L29 [Armatimonadota bacterium]
MAVRRGRELREQTTAQLESELSDALRQLYNLRFSYATQQVGDVKQIRNLRKEIARMKTILRERELAAEQQDKSQ